VNEEDGVYNKSQYPIFTGTASYIRVKMSSLKALFSSSCKPRCDICLFWRVSPLFLCYLHVSTKEERQASKESESVGRKKKRIETTACRVRLGPAHCPCLLFPSESDARAYYFRPNPNPMSAPTISVRI
jgi:hypothetical protein